MNVTEVDIEMVRGWISTGCLTFISFMFARFAVPIATYMTKRLEVKAQERKDERDGWAPLFEAMQRDIETVRKHHAECEAARREDHERINALELHHVEARRADAARISELEGHVAGLTRAISGISLSEAIRLPSSEGKDHLLDIAERSATASLDSISRQRRTDKDG